MIAQYLHFVNYPCWCSGGIWFASYTFFMMLNVRKKIRIFDFLLSIVPFWPCWCRGIISGRTFDEEVTENIVLVHEIKRKSSSVFPTDSAIFESANVWQTLHFQSSILITRIISPSNLQCECIKVSYWTVISLTVHSEQNNQKLSLL